MQGSLPDVKMGGLRGSLRRDFLLSDPVKPIVCTATDLRSKKTNVANRCHRRLDCLLAPSVGCGSDLLDPWSGNQRPPKCGDAREGNRR